MAYTVPEIIPANDVLTAYMLRHNNSQLRKYLTNRIASGDIASEAIETKHILRGEPYGVTADHQFTSTDIYVQHKNKDPYHRSYFTGHIVIPAENLSNTYMPVEGTGKQIYVEESATIFYQVVVENSIQDNYRYDSDGDGIVDSNSRHTAFMVFVDGQPVIGTLGYAFPERKNGYLNTYLDTYEGDQPNTKKRFYQACCAVELEPGWHEVIVKVKCQADMGFAQCRNMTLEVFYV